MHPRCCCCCSAKIEYLLNVYVCKRDKGGKHAYVLRDSRPLVVLKRAELGPVQSIEQCTVRCRCQQCALPDAWLPPCLPYACSPACSPARRPSRLSPQVQEEAVTRWCCIHEGTIKARAFSHRCTYLPGEEVQVMIEVDNQSPHRIEAVQVCIHGVRCTAMQSNAARSLLSPYMLGLLVCCLGSRKAGSHLSSVCNPALLANAAVAAPHELATHDHAAGGP